MQLCLGTAQFVGNYGITNSKRYMSTYEPIRTIEQAVKEGIYAFDTADIYGDAEHVIGDFFARSNVPREKIKIFTKMPPNVLDNVPSRLWKKTIIKQLEKTLKALNLEYLDAYLLHNASCAYQSEILEILQDIKKSGKVNKTGISIYEVQEAQACINHKCVEYIQLPFSVMDQRMKHKRVIDDKNTIIAVRSIFTQGLICMDVNLIPHHLSNVKRHIVDYQCLCREWGYSAIEVAVGYIKAQSNIGYLVFGVDTSSQLIEVRNAFSIDIPNELLAILENRFSNIEKELVMPKYW